MDRRPSNWPQIIQQQEQHDVFLHQPEGIFLRSENELLNVGKTLDIGTYVVKVTPGGEFYLSQVENFTKPAKLYGTVQTKARRILDTFNHRPAGTGVLLSGEQGSGKTMLARELSLMALELGVSTIIVGEPFSGSNFNSFMQRIDVPAVVIIDEFEKTYDDEGQQSLLTLLDGVFPSKKLFILTCNDLWSINRHMLNRPGRLFYHLRYVGLEKQFISEYCEDVLNNKAQIPDVLRVANLFTQFNFDILKALVEEMNRFDMNVKEAITLLNIAPDRVAEMSYRMELFIDGEMVNKNSISPDEYTGNPLDGSEVQIHLSRYDEDDEDDIPRPRGRRASRTAPSAEKKSDLNGYHRFSITDMVSASADRVVFERDRLRLVMTRIIEKQFSFESLLF